MIEATTIPFSHAEQQRLRKWASGQEAGMARQSIRAQIANREAELLDLTHRLDAESEDAVTLDDITEKKRVIEMLKFFIETLNSFAYDESHIKQTNLTVIPYGKDVQS